MDEPEPHRAQNVQSSGADCPRIRTTIQEARRRDSFSAASPASSSASAQAGRRNSLSASEAPTPSPAAQSEPAEVLHLGTCAERGRRQSVGPVALGKTCASKAWFIDRQVSRQESPTGTALSESEGGDSPRSSDESISGFKFLNGRDSSQVRAASPESSAAGAESEAARRESSSLTGDEFADSPEDGLGEDELPTGTEPLHSLSDDWGSGVVAASPVITRAVHAFVTSLEALEAQTWHGEGVAAPLDEGEAAPRDAFARRASFGGTQRVLDQIRQQTFCSQRRRSSGVDGLELFGGMAGPARANHAAMASGASGPELPWGSASTPHAGGQDRVPTSPQAPRVITYRDIQEMRQHAGESFREASTQLRRCERRPRDEAGDAHVATTFQLEARDAGPPPNGVDPQVWSELPPEARAWALSSDSVMRNAPATGGEAAVPSGGRASTMTLPGSTILGTRARAPCARPRHAWATLGRHAADTAPPNDGDSSGGGRAPATMLPGATALGARCDDPRAQPRHALCAPSRNAADTDPLAEGDTSGGTCIVCTDAPAVATFVHGFTGHTACCLSCAWELERRGSSCPVCRQPFSSIIRNFS
mmetsp:Transcript_81825/g.227903  ORF Transcript_81825/g.227903 Transcript_81825/m.227903 type:complete len:592 (-) Transcript_81825:92-1867(-)